MEFFTTVAQLLPIYVGGLVLLAAATTKRWVRVTVVVAGVSAAIAEAMCLIALAGLGSGTGLGKWLVLACACLTVGLGGVGLFVAAVPKGDLRPIGQWFRPNHSAAPLNPPSPATAGAEAPARAS